MGIANLSGHQRCCHIFFHLLLRLVAVLNVVVVVLILLILLLLLLLLPLCVLLIKDIELSAGRTSSCTSICRKMIWGLTARTSRMGHRGLGFCANRTVVCCTDVVVQWLARGTGRGSMRAHRIERRSFLFGKPQARSRLEEVINIVPPIGTGKGRSCR
jgi:hypothetical protein